MAVIQSHPLSGWWFTQTADRSGLPRSRFFGPWGSPSQSEAGIDMNPAEPNVSFFALLTKAFMLLGMLEFFGKKTIPDP
jgi:hypothetical protein